MSLPCGSDAAQTIEVLLAVQRQLDDAAGRLRDVAGRAAAVAAQTDWRTDAARLFHANAEAWRREVAALADDVACTGASVGRDCTRVEAHVWWWGS